MPIIGGSAGDDLAFKKTQVYFDEQGARVSHRPITPSLPDCTGMETLWIA